MSEVGREGQSRMGATCGENIRFPCAPKSDLTRQPLYTNNTISCLPGSRTWKDIRMFSFTPQGPHLAT